MFHIDFIYNAELSLQLVFGHFVFVFSGVCSIFINRIVRINIYLLHYFDLPAVLNLSNKDEIQITDAGILCTKIDIELSILYSQTLGQCYC